jgi:hypothetical protein
VVVGIQEVAATIHRIMAMVVGMVVAALRAGTVLVEALQTSLLGCSAKSI